jgi:glycosyltransferase involved in cell wall biosynthesis
MSCNDIDLICLSHLRWSFVFQRPQHLMCRFAKDRRVFYFEEPVREDSVPNLRSRTCAQTGVRVVTPVLPLQLSHDQAVEEQKRLLRQLLVENDISGYVAWYYTPMAMQFSTSLQPRLTVYDCMDELSAFAGAPADMRRSEQALFAAADLVFTGGASLFESKRKSHPAVYFFPSSVDVSHFAKAKRSQLEPSDQTAIPRPRLGYAGVIDERMDLSLVEKTAALRPDWHFVFLGPVVKIDTATLPQAPNIHYLGMKQYSELPAYFSCWDIALLPFALNESTRFISPTKTPEYLAAGLPVISTPIRDVVHPYGDLGFARIVANPDEFVNAAQQQLSEPVPTDLRDRIEKFLARSSWDKTQKEMDELMKSTLRSKQDQTSPMVLSDSQGLSTAGVRNV